MLTGGVGSFLRRLLALGFLAVILADLADASCDPLVRTGRETGREACSIVCVADCFCCASKIAAAEAPALAESAPAEPAPVPALGQRAPGVLPAPYHPPKTL